MTTWTTGTQDSSSWANSSQDASTFTPQSKNFTSFEDLLLETGSYVLLETGDKIILDQTATASAWTNLSES